MQAQENNLQEKRKKGTEDKNSGHKHTAVQSDDYPNGRPLPSPHTSAPTCFGAATDVAGCGERLLLPFGNFDDCRFLTLKIRK